MQDTPRFAGSSPDQPRRRRNSSMGRTWNCLAWAACGILLRAARNLQKESLVMRAQFGDIIYVHFLSFHSDQAFIG